jgi:sugar phosphate isomerase/epimerase
MINLCFMLIDPPSSWDEDIEKTLSFIKSCGYGSVELNLTSEVITHLDEIEQSINCLGLSVPSFLTGSAYGDGLCLSSPNQEVRDQTINRLISYIDIARRFQSILVVGLLQGLRTDEPDEDIANMRIVEALKQVGEEADMAGVDIVIEPVNHLQVGFNHSVGEVQKLIGDIDSPAIKPMVDTIHMNIEETSVIKPIYDCGDQLRHVHLCESNGGIPGTGHIDFKAVIDTLRKIDYGYYASVKVYRKSGVKEAAMKSMTYFNPML